jgi:hypothetical protein
MRADITDAGLELLRCVVQSRRRSLYPYNARVQLQGNHIRAPREARRNLQLAWQLQRSLYSRDAMLDFSTASIAEKGIVCVALLDLTPIDKFIERRR